MKRICAIYRSRRHPGMYLFVDKQEALSRVPEALLQRFGEAEFSMTLLLHPERSLARANAEKVLSEIAEQGFYLQLPPVPGTEVEV
ncbi:YcgL domain-containing protein [Spongiibacter taiwanensis]|uniref:YcgL domain-containing protein n=1 Tax=Spongiibacter taiwanensis TaxID=1748242 RepID=UPI002034D49E|nr:YcgL domain-containing protein [Spongiibacter taiwanensis]USA43555.1 YcgL domain-containing protein [Spongiibacter taiwanensis]